MLVLRVMYFLDVLLGAVEMTPDQCYEVFDAVNEVMYKEMGFKGNKDDYYNRDNSFMSKVHF